MRNHLFLLFIICVFFNIQFLGAQELRGKVLDQETAFPVSNTEVSINNETYYTDPSGKFKISLKEHTGDLDITVGSDGYTVTELNVHSDGKSDIEMGIIFLEESEGAS